MPAFTPRPPTMPTSLARDTASTITAQAPHDSPQGDGSATVPNNGGETSGLASEHRVTSRKQETRKARKAARTATVENASAVIVGDAIKRQGGNKADTVKHAAAVELVRAGSTIEGAAKVVGLSPTRVKQVWDASGAEVEALQKELAPRQWKIATLADDLLMQKLRDGGERLGASELSIVKGVAVQRGVELAKLPTTSAPPDWAALAGWSGTQDGGTVDDGKEGDK